MNAAVAEQGSIAVLPFVNTSSDPEQQYFSDGITEELLNVLAQLPELRVRDIFAVQDEISREIVRQLQINMRRSTEEALQETEELLTEALERDSEYAQAHALMATAHTFQVHRRWSPPQEVEIERPPDPLGSATAPVQYQGAP